MANIEVKDESPLDIKDEAIGWTGSQFSSEIKNEQVNDEEPKPSVSFQMGDVVNSPIKSQKLAFSCNVCDYQAACRQLLERHLLTHNGEQLFACTTGGTTEGSFECNCCHHKSVNETALAKPAGLGHRETWVCNMCDYKSANEKRLSLHIKRHAENKLLTCNVCNYISPTRHCLLRHMKGHRKQNLLDAYRKTRHFTGRLYPCSICDYVSATKSVLIDHIRKHSAKQLFACKICDYKSVSSVDSKQHMRRHMNKMFVIEKRQVTIPNLATTIRNLRK